jgi:glutamate N-acetyltransferase/amino-acid N-acetyltransferase
MNFTSLAEYNNHLKDILLPRGITGSTTSLKFVPHELSGSGEEKSLPMNLTLIALDEPTDRFSALYTRNAFPGHPVIIGRELLKEKWLKGLIINNKISNVQCPEGYNSSQVIRKTVENLLPGKGVVFPFSTGIIGWELPLKEMKEKLPELVDSRSPCQALSLAQSIMTTDSFAKVRTIKLGNGRITGICKGAGMIEPHLATMLVFVMTDLDITREELDRCWKISCEKSFNRISVDSDQSTSDTAFIFSTAKAERPDLDNFQEALNTLTTQMASDIVRNGEGTGHVLEVLVNEALHEEEALSAAKAIINSPLTKSAIYGNDPNVGRLIQALGDWAGVQGIPLNTQRVNISMGDVVLYSNGTFSFDGEKEKILHNYLKERSLPLPSPGFPAHEKNVNIKISLGRGDKETLVWGSDLSCEYVVINAEYRS